MSINTQLGAAQGIDLLDTTASTSPEATSLVPLPRGARKLAQRGMSTAEYAVGILAAVSLALVLLRIITGAEFFKGLLEIVLKILGWVGGKI